MAQKTDPEWKPTQPAEPRGFGEHTRGLGSEYAHEQGWGLDIEERTRVPKTPENTFGGTDYEYGARDFGDEAVNTEIAPQQPNQIPHDSSSARKVAPDPIPEKDEVPNMPNDKAQKQEQQQKKHGDTLDRALENISEHTVGGNKDIDPVPEPEEGGHARSHAAHLGGHVEGHPKPAGNLRQGSAPGALRQPPQEIGRAGKQHRGQ